MEKKLRVGNLGPIRQLAFLTRDIDASIDFYSRLGIGPWFHGDRPVFDRLIYRDAPSSPDLRFAVAAWGDMQIELIEPIGAGPSVVHEWMHRDFGNQIQHHVAIWPEDIEQCLDAALSRGFAIVQDGMTATGRFLYLADPEYPDFFIEITHATPERQAFSRHVSDCAKNWDGSRPVRRYGSFE
jgi:NADPH2:quinone reductase